MKKRTIIIASILKPVDDTRMFEKFAISLSDSGNYDVVIIGYPSVNKPAYPNIEFIPLKPFSRLSIGRLLASLEVLSKLHKVKHDILIVNTHELLIVALLNRIFFGKRIIYDIRENYYRNILHTEAFPKWIRSVLALWVRAKEKLTSPLFNWFLLAEKGYEKEFSFAGKKISIIENKPRVPATFIREKSSRKTNLLFSGTLAESTGVFQAIDLAKDLHQVDRNISLHIVGYAAQHDTYLRIKAETSRHSFITLLGGNYLVPHDEIMNAIQRADFGIIIYPLSPHTQNSMPTKLYEYIATKLPILLQNHAPWVAFCDPFQAAIILEKDLTPGELLSQMKSAVFYPGTEESNQVSWTSEETKLLETIGKL